jgi:uncharacterized protein (DUF433 family)
LFQVGALEIMSIVVSNPNVLWGLPVFEGTKVPARTLTEYIAAGDSLDVFLEDFPSVSREQAVALLEATICGDKK